VAWTVEIGQEFEPEFDALHEDVQDEILAVSRLLQQFGPELARPRVDTLKGSRHANMKELRFSAADGEWRVAFRFRYETKGHFACCWGQVGRRREAVLPRTDSKSGCPFRLASRSAEAWKEVNHGSKCE
jgi:hypothetical protein